jgi:predicted dehydrogenase
MDLKRRSFLLAGSSMLVVSAAPSEQLILGVIGSGGRGLAVMKAFQRHPEVKVAGICDVYEPNLNQAISEAAKGGSQPKAYHHYHDLLANKDIHAVLIATPEHWHCQMTVDAIAAGKDVYIEKPLCHTPAEGRTLVEAAKKSKSIIQVGMQRRSYDLYLAAREVLSSGTLGTVRMVRSWWLNNNLKAQRATSLEGKLDWDLWQGPAVRRPFDPDRFRNWRDYSDYSGGIVADQGAHVYDGIHMLMNAGFPLAVNSSAGRIHKPWIDTPESVVVTAEYPEDFVAVFTINYAAMRYQPRNDQLNQFDGDQARLDIGREDFKVFRLGEEDQPQKLQRSQSGFGHATELHVDNFLECVKTRKAPTAPVELGFQAALVIQMANLSRKQGRRLCWNAKTQTVVA